MENALYLLDTHETIQRAILYKGLIDDLKLDECIGEYLSLDDSDTVYLIDKVHSFRLKEQDEDEPDLKPGLLVYIVIGEAVKRSSVRRVNGSFVLIKNKKDLSPTERGLLRI